jgi:hypothetical protein
VTRVTGLIRATVEAMGTGDTSAVSTSLSELASISPNSAGASVLAQASENYGSSSSSTSSTSSVSQILQSLDSNGSSSSTALLDQLA